MTIKKLSREEYKQVFSNNNIVGTSGHLPKGNTLKGLIYRCHVSIYLLKNKANYL